MERSFHPLTRVAAVVALLQGTAHGALVLRAHETGHLLGYGLMVAFNCVIEAALLVFVPGRAVPIILIAANLVHAFLVARYFFALPFIFDLLVIALLAGALLSGNAGRAGRKSAAAGEGAGG
jgi:hypothetical protein